MTGWPMVGPGWLTVQAFLDEYAEALDAAYPREPHGVVLGFRRIFAVGHKPG